MAGLTFTASWQRLLLTIPPATFLVLLLILSGIEIANAQKVVPGSEWTPVAAASANVQARAVAAVRWSAPGAQEKIYDLDFNAARARYAQIPVNEPSVAQFVGDEIALPMPDGSLQRFKVVEAPVMAPELAAQFPEIKTYAGQGIDDPEATVRLSFSPLGFHAQILSPRGAVYVDPVFRGNTTRHKSAFKRDLNRASNWSCIGPGKPVVNKIATNSTSSSSVAPATTVNRTLAKVQSGTTLRTYRLAVSCTGEYAAFFGGTVPLAQAAIVAAVNRVVGVYEKELAVRMVLVANNNNLIYLNSATDPFDNSNGSTMLGQNQTTVDNTIGSANYDIGHVFSTGGGGVALLGCVCKSGLKAQGVTGWPSPTGDAFWIDYVAHEMGHQFGADHTFNSTSGSCSGNRNSTTAFEIGSGSTIMAYAGICSPDDLQSNSDPYFHGGSIDEIQAYIASGATCAATSATGNSAPAVSGGGNYTIPVNTPFMLTASGTDPNGDVLTYGWEEMDLGAAQLLTAGDNGSSPIFRSFNPTASPTRFFPRLSSILANTNWNQEKLPTTSRAMKFRVTARDNRAGGGGVADAEVTITSTTAAGPFVITSPNIATNWSGPRTVLWNVANTTSAPVNAAGVDIWLSTNSGQTFTFLLSSNAPNNGSASVVLPNLNSTKARLMVRGNNNVFFDINNADFTITPGANIPLVQLAGTQLVSESCTPTNGAVDPLETVSVSFNFANFGNAPTTNLVATLLATNGIVSSSGAQNYGVIGAGSNLTRTFTFTPSGICGGSVTGVVSLVDGATSYGNVSVVFPLGKITLVATQIFTSANSITIRDFTNALPYPSTLAVSGVSSPVSKMTVTLSGLTHTFPSDVSVLLVNPSGQGVKLMAANGGGTDISGVNLTFDDAATANLTGTAIVSGTYRPTDLRTNDVFNSPAPSSPYMTNLTMLAASPNGTWNLYVQDFANADSGSISGGWSLLFVNGGNSTNCCATVPAPNFTSTTWSNRVVRFTWNSQPGAQYQVQYRTNLLTGIWLNLGSPVTAVSNTVGIVDNVSNAPVRFYRVSIFP